MSEGQHAAEQTKDVFRQAGDATEGLRQNINSFADNLLGGNKQHGSGEVHPDAKKTGNALQQGVENAGAKLDQSVGNNKTKDATLTDDL